MPALLDESSVAILAGRHRDGRLIAGAIATAGDVAVGISNVFVTDTGLDNGATLSNAFAGATGAIVERFPDRPVVGYRVTTSLAVGLAAGFQAVGPLRVWASPGFLTNG